MGSNICPYCGKELSSKLSLDHHIKYLHELVMQKCLLCDKTFTPRYKNSLKRHMEIAHSEKNHQCPDCGKMFTTQRRLKIHADYHHDQSKLLECEICTAEF